MLVLRILSLPLALAAFALLYVVANKAPHAVESINVFVWLLLPALVGLKIFARQRK
ncbi:hypothetical protein J2T09_002458 [Neorhizobium huautlense]|uniref:Transmembrane protein n=1 Tax=Neorhizobium huautlense TaxID=67774 RepID=A0ABT9PTA3_9HYPH|nr:hypothetical protein [Neorhizobium huautlense]